MEEYITRLVTVKQVVAMFQGKSWSLDETLLTNIQGIQDVILQLQDIAIQFRAIIEDTIITIEEKKELDSIFGKISEILGTKNKYCNAILHQIQCVQNIITSLPNLFNNVPVINHIEFHSFPFDGVDSSSIKLLVLDETMMYKFLLNLKDLFIQDASISRKAIIPELEEILDKMASCCTYLDPFLTMGNTLFKTTPAILSYLVKLGNDLATYFQPFNMLLDSNGFQTAFRAAKAAWDTLVASEEIQKTHRVKLKSMVKFKKERAALDNFAKLLAFKNNLHAETNIQEKETPLND